MDKFDALFDELDSMSNGEVQNEYSRPRSALNAGLQAFGSGVASIPKAVGEGAVALANKFGDSPILGNPDNETPEDTYSYQIGQAIDAYFRDNFPTNPAYDDEFWAKAVPSGVGSTVSFFLGGLAGRAAKIPALATTTTMGMAASGVGQVEDYKQVAREQGKEIDPETRAQSFGYGSLGGIGEGIPLSNMLSRLDKLTGGRVKQVAVGAIKEGSEEYLQEGTQGIIANLVASNVVKYDPDRDTFDGVSDQADVGFVSGTLIGGIVTALGVKRNRDKGLPDNAPDGKKEVVDSILKSADEQAKDPNLQPMLDPVILQRPPGSVDDLFKKVNFDYERRSLTDIVDERLKQVSTPPIKGPAQLLAEARAKAEAEGKDPLEQAKDSANALAQAMASFRGPAIPNPFQESGMGILGADPVPQRVADTVFERETAPKEGTFIPAQTEPGTSLSPFTKPETARIGTTIDGQVDREALTNQNIIYGEGPTVAGLLPEKIRMGMDGQPLVSNRMDGTSKPLSGDLKAEVARLKEISGKQFIEARKRRTGKKVKAWTPNRKTIDLQYEVVESDKLVRSNHDQGEVNQAYPQELQPRDRTSVQSRQQVTEISGALIPDWLGSSSKVDDGAPIVDSQSLAVISGNGRSMALDRHYRQGDRSGYKQWLIDNAKQFGLNPKEVEKMKAPVLVRKLLTPMTDAEKVEMAGKSNDRTQLAMTPTETAVNDAKRISDEVLADIVDGDMTKAANLPFIRKMIQAFGANEAANLMDSQGNANQALRDRLRNAIVANAYGNKRLTQTVSEGTTDDRKILVNALVEMAASFAKLQKTGRYSGIAAEIGAAMDILRNADTKGLTVNEYLSQMDSFTKRSETAEILALFFDRHKKSKPAIVEGLRDVYSELEAADNYQESGSDMFGDYTPPGIPEIVKRRLKDEVETVKANSRNGARSTGQVRSRGSQGDNAADGANQTDSGAAQATTEQAEPEFNLNVYSEADIAAQEKAQREAAEAEAKAKKAEEDKIKADEALDSFNLTGSDLPADIAAAAGQEDIFSQPEQSIPLNQITIKQQSTDEKTGETVETEEKADVLLRRLDKKLATFKALLDCVKTSV